jgi:hypothetical protein
MKTDTLHRRLRHARPSPRVGRLCLTEADYLIFEAINRHGPLPTPYLYEVTKHLRKDFTHLQNRLTEFYHGDEGGPYLTRPPQQFAGYEARYQPLVYDLSTRARQALAERGTHGHCLARRTDPFLHQLMTACVAASLELTLPANGLRYISRKEILSHEKFPDEARRRKNPLAVSLPGGERRSLIPDDLFGVEYPGVGFRFFALEVDRNTESIDRRSLDQTGFARKIAGYLSILTHGLHRQHWGLPNLSILTVTTNAAHARNILKFIGRLNEPRYTDRFYFHVETSFSANWRVPRTVLSRLVAEPWSTVGGMKEIGVA